MICPQCGYSGLAQTFMEGSTWIGVVLCLVWLVPGLLYFIWQSTTRYQGCPQCRSRTMFSLHSPEGHFAASRFYNI